MTTAVEQVQDAWWDVNEKFIVTVCWCRTGHSTEDRQGSYVHGESSGGGYRSSKKEASLIKKLPPGILLTGSISTFKMAATRQSKVTNKSNKKVQTSTNQPSVLTTSSFSKADMFKLLEKCSKLTKHNNWHYWVALLVTKRPVRRNETSWHWGLAQGLSQPTAGMHWWWSHGFVCIAFNASFTIIFRLKWPTSHFTKLSQEIQKKLFMLCF